MHSTICDHAVPAAVLQLEPVAPSALDVQHTCSSSESVHSSFYATFHVACVLRWEFWRAYIHKLFLQDPIKRRRSRLRSVPYLLLCQAVPLSMYCLLTALQCQE